MASEAHSSADEAEDRRELNRTVAVNATGYLIKVGHPALFFLVAALFGAAELGVFHFAEQVVFLTMRTALLGLDKSLLWWLPRQSESEPLAGFRSAFLLALGFGAALALLFALGLADPVALLLDRPEAVSTLQLTAFATIPMIATEMWVATLLAKRQAFGQVVVKDSVVPLLHVGLAVLAYFFVSRTSVGIALAFVIAHVAGAALSYRLFRRAYSEALCVRREPDAPGDGRLPGPLRRYTLPIWASELNASLVLRMDSLIVGALGDATIVGVYAVVVKVANAVRGIRRSFDPIVWALVSKIGPSDEPERLRAAFSHATVMTVTTQMPVFAFLMAFAPDIFSRLGADYAQGALAIVIFCGFWVVNGLVGLNGLIVAGSGRGGWVFANSLVGLCFQLVLLVLLVPSFGVEGAAVAAGTSYTAQNLIQALQARVIVGAWPYRREVAFVVASFALAGAVALAVALLALPWGQFVARVAGFVAFLVLSASACLLLRRRGLAFCGASSAPS